MIPRVFITSSVILILFSIVNSKPENEGTLEENSIESTGRQLIEQGRTLVHRTVKRLMVILPAVFFKLGIAFTLLVLVALAVVGNGFVGFLILVVGLSGVLSRLQGVGYSNNPVALQYAVAPPLRYHHAQLWDRSDNHENDNGQNFNTKGAQNQMYYHPQLGNYYASKYAQANKS